MQFTVESFFNPHLALGTNRVDAVLTVTASGEGGAIAASSGAYKAVVFVIDVSGSMAGDRILAAKHAVRRCIDLLDESTLFSVIAFYNQTEVLLPLSPATEVVKAAAHQRVQKLNAGGTTVMSAALLAARDQLKGAGNVIGYTLFLTDGKNDEGDHAALLAAIRQCEGVFQCDCRGIGTDWQPADLRQISGALLGNADAVARPDKLAEDFHASLTRALSKGLGDVRLRLWSPRTAKLVSIKQMSPEIADLLGFAKRIDDKTLEVPLGAWGTEARDYHIALEVEAGVEGDEMLACRPSVVFAAGGVETKAAGQPVIAAWTNDAALSARINPQVAHYTGQEELAESIRDGLEAKARGDLERATKLLGKATKIAAESGNHEVTRRLTKVVDVVDAREGTVRLKSGAGKAELLELDMGGTRTVRRRPAAG